MRTVTNKKRVERNRRTATYLFIATMVILVGSFIFVNVSLFTGQEPNMLMFLLQALSLPVAFVMTLLSIRMTNQWARRPFPEETLKEGMKGISKRSVLYNYYHDPARHVLIAPQGVFAIVTRWHEDHFSVEGDEWTTHKSAISKLFSSMRMDGVGNPTSDAEKAADHVRELLADIAPDVDVQPLVIFTNPNAELDITEPDVPVLYADDKEEPNLTGYMRELNRQQKDNMQQKSTLPLTEEQINQFEEQTVG
jgi:hypothetical protein